MLRKQKKDISIFNMSMLDVISGAMGAFLLVMLVLIPYYGKTLTLEEAEEIKQTLTDARNRLKNTQQALDQVQDTAVRRQALEEVLAETRASLTSAQQAHDAAMTRARQILQQLQQKKTSAERRLGFALKERRLVFIVDVSGSMGTAGENSIEAVVAGVKMLVATMDDRYEVEVVYFPDEPNGQDYGYLWGRLRGVTLPLKYEAYRFLSALSPDGTTPTESVFDYILNQPAYQDAGALILLTDGEPDEPDDASDDYHLQLADDITRKNNGRFRICSIGVGSDFRDRTVDSDAEQFLQRLAAQNDGFYIGF